MAPAAHPVPYVITEGDEGVQINVGRRLAFAGAGFHLAGFSQAVAILKKLLTPRLTIAGIARSDWFKEQLDLADWGQVEALTKQHVAAIADREKITYAGWLPFADPTEIEGGVKGHLVRPKDIHLAQKICFTLGGGEAVFNLSQYLISADWLALAPEDLAADLLTTQIDFYQRLAGKELTLVYQLAGSLGQDQAEANLKVLKKLQPRLTNC